MEEKEFGSVSRAAPKGLTLDRINPQGHYEPTNCRWAPWKVLVENQGRILWKHCAPPSIEDIRAMEARIAVYDAEINSFLDQSHAKEIQPDSKAETRRSVLEESCAEREPDPLPLVSLPVDVSDLDGISWKPTREEILLERLRAMQATWEREDIERHRRRAAEIAAVVSRDIAWLERVNAIQKEQQRVENYWLEERKKTADAIHKAQLKRLAQINEDIRKSDARLERRELLRRGVYRGRRQR
jgi:hypothetical protein